MRIAFYGLSCSGKDYLLSKMPFIEHIKGSEWLNAHSGGRFRELSSDEQDILRREFIGYIRSCSDTNVAVDGHYAFPSEGGFDIAFTEADGDCYDVFAYLDTPSEIIRSRLQESEKNSRYAELSVEAIESWKQFEIEGLRRECLERGKEFLLLDGNIENVCCFIRGLVEGRILTAPQVAKRSADQILAASGSRLIVLCDGDKTATASDLTKKVFEYAGVSADNNVFSGDKYSTYQFWLSHRDIAPVENIRNFFGTIVENADVEDDLLKDLSMIDGFRVVVSAGLEELWKAVADRTGIFDMAIGSSIDVSSNISQLAKAFLVRYLHSAGREVIAVGDNVVDYYMLLEADKGYVVAHKKKNTSLQKLLLNGTVLKQPRSNEIKFDGVAEVNSIHEDIE